MKIKTTPTLFVTLVMYSLTVAIRQIQFDSTLNESGRYLYDDPKRPGYLICSYCDPPSLMSESSIRRNQEIQCLNKNYPHWENEKDRFSPDVPKFAYCKEDGIRERPGCGDLKYYPNQESWKIVLPDPDNIEESITTNTSLVYHSYRPVCKEGYRLFSASVYRCGENLKWNNSDPVICETEDPTTTPLSNSLKDPTTIVIVVFAAVLLVTVVSLLIMSYKKGWIKCVLLKGCFFNRSKPSNNSHYPNLSAIESECGKSVTSERTDHTVLSEDSGQSKHVRRQNKYDKGICDIAEKKLIQKGTDEREYVTVFGACKVPVGDDQIPNFKVFRGCDVYPTTRVKLKKSGQFTLEKKDSSSLCNGMRPNLQRKYNFLYVMDDVTMSDSGTYCWTVVDHKKKQYNGSFYLKVIEGEERPPPLGRSIECLPTNEDIRENILTGQGPGDSIGVNATPMTEGNFESHNEYPEHTSIDHELTLPKEIVVSCQLTLEQAWDDPKHCQVIQKLCYHLDPLHNGQRRERWPGLISHFLGKKVSRAYINSIEWHKRGNPDDGPTAFVLPQLCSEGYTIGHIVWYFSQPGQLYLDVVKMLAQCHDCHYCKDIYHALETRTNVEKS